MSKKENIIKEYETLREEMLQKIELHNSLITFMITTVVALLTFSLTTRATFVFITILYYNSYNYACNLL